MKDSLIYKIVSNLDQAFAFFDHNHDLKHYNKAFLELWLLNEKLVEELNPSITDFFSMIIENNTLLITESPSQFIRSINRVVLEKNLNISKTILCNPNKIVSEKILSLENGVLFLWKDNTNINNLHKEVSIINSNISQIIKNIPIPLLFVESNGKIIEQSNSFNHSLGIFCKEGMHIREVLEKLEGFIGKENSFNKLVESILNQYEYSNHLTNESGDTVYVKVIPLLSSRSILFMSLEQKEINILENIDLIKASLQESYKDIYSKLDTYINNPLTNSKNYLELVTNKYTGDLNKRQVSLLNKAQVNIEDISSYVSYHVENINIYDDNIELENVNLDEIITKNIIALNREIEQKHIMLSLDLEDNITLQSHKKQLNRLIKLILSEVVNKLPYKGVLEIYSSSSNLFTLKHNSQIIIFPKSNLTKDIKTLLVFNMLKNLNIEINQQQGTNLREITLTAK